MRFGKRARSKAGMGAKSMERSDLLGTAAIASDERTALLEHPEEVTMLENEGMGNSNLAADPTQRLLTALGRFQRQVSKAEDGVPQEGWCDECVSQIVSGIEIAHSQGWANVREALTDTARILQSYEEAGRAHESVTFLQDSYEILCLMVGDIIVDNTRSGVMSKWRERYQAALQSVEQAGLRIISDDEEESSDISTPFGDTESLPGSGAGSEPEEIILPEWEEHTAAAEQEAEDGIEEFTANTEGVAGEAFEDTAEELPEMDVFAPETQDAGEEEYLGEAAPDGVQASLEDDTAAYSEVLEPALETEMLIEEASTEFLEMAHQEADATEEMIFGEPEAVDEAGLEEVVAAIEEAYTQEQSTGTLAVASEPEAAPEAEEEYEAGVQEEAEAEAPGDTPQDHEHPELKALFQTVQNAVIRGDVSQAKVLALQLAASMAQLEAERAQHDLEKAERRLQEHEEATGLAEQAVREVEEELQRLEQRTMEAQQEYEARRQQTGELRERVVAMEQVIEDLDAQILALQERREQECTQREAVESALEEALAEESRVHTGLEELAESERQEQQRLAEHRDQVDRLRQLRGEHEEQIARDRALLEQRKSSVGDIERTLGSPEGVEGGQLGEAG